MLANYAPYRFTVECRLRSRSSHRGHTTRVAVRRGVRDRHRLLRDAVGDRDDVRVRDRHELSRGRPDRVWCIVYELQ